GHGAPVTAPARRPAGGPIVRFHAWRRPRPRLRLLCLPAAGGGLFAYQRWPDELPVDVEVCTVQLPGREDRFLEPALTSTHEVVGHIVDAVAPHLAWPFAIYGHSMGAILGFELA